MQKITVLKQQAIQAAKNSSWQDALDLNQQIIDQSPKDIEALNRLGLAYLQTDQPAKASKIFKQVLCIDKLNPIAKKHLEKIKNKQKPNTAIFSNNDFIENPGQSKTIELHRLADKKIIESLHIGENCQLVSKNRFISIETTERKYIGSLPEDLSFRLSKLIKNGNLYSCHIKSCSCKGCLVHIKEVKRSNKNMYLNSFPVSKSTAVSSVKETLVIDEKIPIEIDDNENAKVKAFEETLEAIQKS
jgi:tetratricopeptide (TPR) repeat protein